MAYIDKIYVGSYYNFSKLKKWALIYYPKLLLNFYHPFMSETEWNNWQREKFDEGKKWYKGESPIYEMEFNEAQFEDDFEKLCCLPIANTPIEVDRKLLWFCPIDFVRDYLEKNCEYKTRWYHKIFWKGRKYFSY